MKRSKTWQVYNSLIDSVMYKSNGKAFGRGYKEVQIRRSNSGFQICLTDGAKIERVKYTSDSDIESVKFTAETLLESVA